MEWKHWINIGIDKLLNMWGERREKEWEIESRDETESCAPFYWGLALRKVETKWCLILELQINQSIPILWVGMKPLRTCVPRAVNPGKRLKIRAWKGWDLEASSCCLWRLFLKSCDLGRFLRKIPSWEAVPVSEPLGMQGGCSQSCWAGNDSNTIIPIPSAALPSCLCWGSTQVSLKAFWEKGRYQTLPIIFFCSSKVQERAQFVAVGVCPRCFSSWELCLEVQQCSCGFCRIWAELLPSGCSFLSTGLGNGGSELFQTQFRNVCWG